MKPLAELAPPNATTRIEEMLVLGLGPRQMLALGLRLWRKTYWRLNFSPISLGIGARALVNITVTQQARGNAKVIATRDDFVAASLGYMHNTPTGCTHPSMLRWCVTDRKKCRISSPCLQPLITFVSHNLIRDWRLFDLCTSVAYIEYKF